MNLFWPLNELHLCVIRGLYLFCSTPVGSSPNFSVHVYHRKEDTIIYVAENFTLLSGFMGKHMFSSFCGGVQMKTPV